MERGSNDMTLARWAVVTLASAIATLCALGPESSLLPRCAFHDLTGFFCPGCGTTRMLYELFHNHPVLALHQNAMSMLALPFVLYGLLRQALRQTQRWPSVPARWVVAFGILLMTFTLVRNVPVRPFSDLAPTSISLDTGR